MAGPKGMLQDFRVVRVGWGRTGEKFVRSWISIVKVKEVRYSLRRLAWILMFGEEE